MKGLRDRVVLLLQEGHPDRVFDELCAARLAPRPDVAAAVTARELLPCVLEQLPRSAFGREREEKLRRLGLPLPPPRSASGRVEFPVVRGAEGRLARVDALVLSDGPDDQLPEGLCEEAEHALRAALRAARRGLSGGAATRGVRVTFNLAPPPQGRSCGLAVALAVRSALCRLPIPDDLAATGEVWEDGTIQAVSSMPTKLRLHRAARPAGRLLAHSSQAPADDSLLLGVLHLDDALERLGAANLDLEHELDAVRSAFKVGSWAAAAERAERLVEQPVLSEGERAELLLVLLAAANHRGAQEQARELRGLLQPLVSTGGVSASLAARALAYMTITAVDRFAVEEAEATLALASTLALPQGDEGWLHLRGAEATLATLRGDFARATLLRRENAAAAPEAERPRCLGDLADALRRSGDLAAGQEALGQAFGALKDMPPRRVAYRDSMRRFLHLHAARLALASGGSAAAAAHLRDARGATGPEVVAALEEALLAPDLAARLQQIDQALPAHQSAPIFAALRARARHLAGEATAAAQLAACMGLPDVPVAQLCLRLPY